MNSLTIRAFSETWENCVFSIFRGWDSSNKINAAINLILTLWSETLGKFKSQTYASPHLLGIYYYFFCFILRI